MRHLHISRVSHIWMLYLGWFIEKKPKNDSSVAYIFYVLHVTFFSISWSALQKSRECDYMRSVVKCVQEVYVGKNRLLGVKTRAGYKGTHMQNVQRIFRNYIKTNTYWTNGCGVPPHMLQWSDLNRLAGDDMSLRTSNDGLIQIIRCKFHYHYIMINILGLRREQELHTSTAYYYYML